MSEISSVEPMSFVPEMTTDSICYGEQTTVCLTDVLDDMQADINGKAEADHTHTGYAAASHTHSGYAASSHTHTPASLGAAAADHTHDYAAPSHSHAQSEITGLADALATKANASDVSSKADLVDGKVPAAQLPAYVDDVEEYAALANFPTTGEAGKIYVATATNKTYRWSGSAYVEIAQGVALGETSATAYRGDRGKTAYDHSQNSTVHVTAAQKAAWDGKAAGNHTHTPSAIGAAAASHSHSYNDLSDKPTIPAAYSHPASHPASMITGLADVATSGSYEDLSDKPTIPTIPSSLPANGGNADTVDGKHASDFATASHTHSGFAASGHTHTPADIGAAAASHTHTGYAASSHNHALSAITGLLDLLATDATGNVSSSASTSDVLAHIKALASGMHTVYAQASAPNAPNSKEGWRFLVHKTGSDTYGWVIAFGTNGSIYTNYLNNGTWRGWKALYEAAPDPLWSGGANGGYYMTAGHTVTPSKKLSECRNGWLLLWSDYDVGGEANNTDFCTTIIPKRAYTGQVWNGAMWYCDVPSYAAGTATDSEVRIIKVLQIYDNRIIGTENNATAPRNDVVLRAVYEF